MRAPRLCTYCGHLLPLVDNDELGCPGCGRSAQGAEWEPISPSPTAGRDFFRKSLFGVVIFDAGTIAMMTLRHPYKWLVWAAVSLMLWFLGLRKLGLGKLVYFGLSCLFAALFHESAIAGRVAIFASVITLLLQMPSFWETQWRFRSPDGKWQGNALTNSGRLMHAGGNSPLEIRFIELAEKASSLAKFSSRLTLGLVRRDFVPPTTTARTRKNRLPQAESAVVFAALIHLAAHGIIRLAAQGSYHWTRGSGDEPRANLGTRGELLLLMGPGEGELDAEERGETWSTMGDRPDKPGSSPIPWVEQEILCALRRLMAPSASPTTSTGSPYRERAALSHEGPDLLPVAMVIRDMVSPAKPHERRIWFRMQLAEREPTEAFSEDSEKAFSEAHRAVSAIYAREMNALRHTIDRAFGKSSRILPTQM